MLYDQVFLTWLQNDFSALLPGRSLQVLVSTPRKEFAEVTTGQLADERTLKIPRITLQRGEPVNDPTRYNSNPIRRLGWSNASSGEQRSLLRGNFPVPVNIPYQVDLWTRFVKEMNLWERYIIERFAAQYSYFSIRPNDTFGNKIFATFQEGALVNNSDLEPKEGQRQIRKTLNLRAECWMFPDMFLSKYVVKRIEVDIRDSDTNALYDTTFLPPLETVGTGDGHTTTFNATLSRPPILAHTAVVQTVIHGTTEVVNDNGSGGWVGSRVAGGTITYSTGVMSIVFEAAPDLNAPVTITYFTDLE